MSAPFSLVGALYGFRAGSRWLRHLIGPPSGRPAIGGLALALWLALQIACARKRESLLLAGRTDGSRDLNQITPVGLRALGAGEYGLASPVSAEDAGEAVGRRLLGHKVASEGCDILVALQIDARRSSAYWNPLHGTVLILSACPPKPHSNPFNDDYYFKGAGKRPKTGRLLRFVCLSATHFGLVLVSSALARRSAGSSARPSQVARHKRAPSSPVWIGCEPSLAASSRSASTEGALSRTRAR